MPPTIARQDSAHAEELEGLRKALRLVRDTKHDMQLEGMSRHSFFLGLMNIAFTIFVLAHWPQHFWAWQTVKCCTLLVMTFLRRRAQTPSTVWYMVEFCWCANVVLAVYGMLCAAGLNTALWPVSPAPTFLAMFGLANGPLGWAVITTHNALVLHSPDHTAALFIHISPPLMSWCFRWHAALLERDWDSRFGSAVRALHGGAGADALTLGAMWRAAMLPYALWWVAYTAWLLLRGRHMTAAKDGCDTLWAYTLRSDRFARGLLGVPDARAGEPGHAALPAVKFMLLHAAGTSLLVVGSYAMWHSFLLHTAFCVMLFAASAWAGAARYEKQTTRWYEKRIEAVLHKTAQMAAPAGDKEE
eukprot:g4669.t1